MKNPQCVRAVIQGEIVIAADGKQYEFLGAGQRYGLTSTYAVRLCGEISAPVLSCYSMPWPFTDMEVAIEFPARNEVLRADWQRWRLTLERIISNPQYKAGQKFCPLLLRLAHFASAEMAHFNQCYHAGQFCKIP